MSPTGILFLEWLLLKLKTCLSKRGMDSILCYQQNILVVADLSDLPLQMINENPEQTSSQSALPWDKVISQVSKNH